MFGGEEPGYPTDVSQGALQSGVKGFLKTTQAFNPLVSASNSYFGFTRSSNIYGEHLSNAGAVWEGVSALLTVVPATALYKSGRFISTPAFKGIGIGSFEFTVMHSKSVAMGVSFRKSGVWAIDFHTLGAGYGQFYKYVPSLHFHTRIPGEFAFRHHVSVMRYLKNKIGSPNASYLDLLRQSKISRAQ